MRWKAERWVKLYTKEEGSFATLSATTRAFAALFLKIVDSSGFIATGRHADIATSICFQIGANQGDRRLVRKAVSDLISDGYLRAASDGVFLRNFTSAQGSKSATSSSRDDHELETSSSRDDHEMITSLKRDDHELETRTGASVQKDTKNEKAFKRRIEEKREEEIELFALSPQTASPPVLVFPCQGKIAKWDLTREQIEKWQRDFYPGIGVESECRKACAWVTANSSNRKTARRMESFLVNWFNRAIQGGKPSPPPRIAAPELAAPPRPVTLPTFGNGRTLGENNRGQQ